MEVQVCKSIWHQGKPITIEEGKPLPVIDLPESEAIYLVGLGRVALIDAEDQPVKAAKPKAKKAVVADSGSDE